MVSTGAAKQGFGVRSSQIISAINHTADVNVSFHPNVNESHDAGHISTPMKRMIFTAGTTHELSLVHGMEGPNAIPASCKYSSAIMIKSLSTTSPRIGVMLYVGHFHEYLSTWK